MPKSTDYHGITYPLPRFLQRLWFWDLWARLCCPHGWHLLDEVWCMDDHYLYCDACEMRVEITEIATR